MEFVQLQHFKVVDTMKGKWLEHFHGFKAHETKEKKESIGWKMLKKQSISTLTQ